MSHFVKNKRQRTDICNMCLEIKDLTWDHVPPQGGGNFTHMEIRSAFDLVISKNEVKPIPQQHFSSQNGIKYRTLCHKCHGLLSKLDIELNNFSNGISKFLKLGLILPDTITYTVRPKKIILALLGHLLAAKQTIEKVAFDEMVRDIFLRSQPIPENLNIFYWIYPFSETIIMRDFGMPSVRGDFSQKLGFFQLIKYFPIAYLISDVPDYANLSSLPKHNFLDENDRAEIAINFRDIPSADWPERIENSNFIFGGTGLSQAIIATRKST